jgi:hypothetical protein
MAAIEKLMNRKVELRAVAGFEPGRHHPQAAPEQPRHNQRPQRPQHRSPHQRRAENKNPPRPQQRPQRPHHSPQPLPGPVSRPTGTPAPGPRPKQVAENKHLRPQVGLLRE